MNLNLSQEELNLAKADALKEYKEDLFRAAVEKEKERLRTKKSLIDRIFPYRILIVKK